MAKLRLIAENIWILQHPLVVAGISLGRTTTIVRLRGEKLLIHSTAPFTSEELSGIHSLGEPGYVVEATRMHNTFAREGVDAFPNVPYFVPDPASCGIANARPMSSLAKEIEDELEMTKVEGIPSMEEHLFWHKASGTLIVADLLFNIGPPANIFTRFMLTWVSQAWGRPAVSRLFRMQVKDRVAFQQSLAPVLETWIFDKVVVAHGDPILRDARPVLAQALRTAGFSFPDR